MSVTDPFDLFDTWMHEATLTEPNDPNAMTLATATPDGVPSARIVLLKGLDPADASCVTPRGFVFYTNRESRKGRELALNNRVALLFHWKTLRRQIRIEGLTQDVTDAEADAYYATRPRQSRLGSWASDQSRPLAHRTELEHRLAQAEQDFPHEDIPRPAYWSGYRVIPSHFEFWQDMPFRLHERQVFSRHASGWTTGKLFP